MNAGDGENSKKLFVSSKIQITTELQTKILTDSEQKRKE